MAHRLCDCRCRTCCIAIALLLFFQDTAGQERFRTITHNYYRGAHGIALVYDVTSRQSFDNIRKWIADVQSFAESNVNIVLIGNKCDLVDAKVIDTEAGRSVAKDFGIAFYEASAKTDTNVQEAFNGLVHQVCDRVISGNNGGAAGGKGAKKPGESQGQSVDVNAQSGEKKKCC
jgi:translation elongation factor EF-4